MIDSKIFGFTGKYSQEFLDQLKRLGFEWIIVPAHSAPFDSISVCPLPPPTGILYFCEILQTTL